MDPIQRKIEQITLNLGQKAGTRTAAIRVQQRGSTDPVPRAANLTRLICERVGALSAADPHLRRKTMRVFLESVFASELGDVFAASPQFATVVDQVQRQMELDAELAPMLEEAVDQLLEARGHAPT